MRRSPNKITFGDVIAERPDTKEKAFARWAYLQSEFTKSSSRKIFIDALKGFGMIGLATLWFAAIIIILCLKHT